MRPPIATYRLQFNSSFRFIDAERLAEYLAELGVSHVYASPVFKARRGSLHGYDVTDTNLLNPELGSNAEFDRMMEAFRRHGVGWVQDVVPNHMAYHVDNGMLRDVLEVKENSRYFGFFDIDWHHHSRGLRGKVLAPFLGKEYPDCLEAGELKLGFLDGEFRLRYFDMELPIRIESYPEILETGLNRVQGDDQACQQLQAAISDVKRLLQGLILPEKAQAVKDRVKMLQRGSGAIHNLLNEVLAQYNGEDRALLDGLLSRQIFKLSHWRTAMKEIDYRRFFNISDLICLSMDDEEIFQETHRLILRAADEGQYSGLRVDHVDGLHDPEWYLRTLRARVPDDYIVVEKILMEKEQLPSSWPVQGTTGYDALDYLNKAFVDEKSESEFDSIYSGFTKRRASYSDVLYRCKKQVVKELFRGDVDNLAWLFEEALSKRAACKGFSFNRLRSALTEIMAVFPVYRTYLSHGGCDEKDTGIIKSSLQHVKMSNPRLAYEVDCLDKLLEELMGEEKDAAADADDVLHCFMRLQQFTGPITAKGLEDTSFYVFNRFISLNEVGSDPGVFGVSVAVFHEFNRTRRDRWPFSLNASSTHDTKRGEDARARLNVLSEIPSEWRLKLRRWSKMNLGKKRRIKKRLVPTLNEEYYLYQTLIGAFPFEPDESFAERVKEHMVKALREAKSESSWLEPNVEHELAVTGFVDRILDASAPNVFLDDFLRFQRRIAFYGVFNSLSQTLLKITVPGVPDVYQGSELWNLSMVDPDNRQPVDYQRRIRMLSKLTEMRNPGCDELAALLQRFEDGRVKLYTVWRALGARRMRRELFEEGEYLPLAVDGERKEHVIAFCRRRGSEWAVIVVPRFLTGLVKVGGNPYGLSVWGDTCITVLDDAPNSWEDVFTGRRLSLVGSGASKSLRLGEVLNGFPVALLVNR
ncbi:MAG: malto-oligosyltrehalose synthase [Thaumarchaeota archaeon]|nr:malto-oligosyltrehalose synthase [Nitrososphaerota archaeon]MCL5317971.1 malto-oligosyltrehalose synthase [Nitrososphaerota archaeon]